MPTIYMIAFQTDEHAPVTFYVGQQREMWDFHSEYSLIRSEEPADGYQFVYRETAERCIEELFRRFPNDEIAASAFIAEFE